MKEEKELPTLEQVQLKIAKKYGLGEKLVTGHAKKYFDEASIEFAKMHLDKFKSELANSPHVLMNEKEINEMYPETNIK